MGLGALWSLWLAHRMGKPLPVLRGLLLRASIAAAIALPLAAWWLQLSLG
jgi:hypothetical protein